jgi:dihydroneopterin aldolase
MDKISVTGLTLYGYHGVYPEENKLGQHYIVDAELFMPLEKPGRSDELTDTVNYAEACELIRQIVEKEQFRLVEALAERVASSLLATYTNVNEVTVRVRKPHPPVAMSFDGVTIEIHRKRA